MVIRTTLGAAITRLLFDVEEGAHNPSSGIDLPSSSLELRCVRMAWILSLVILPLNKSWTDGRIWAAARLHPRLFLFLISHKKRTWCAWKLHVLIYIKFHYRGTFIFIHLPKRKAIRTNKLIKKG